MDDQPTTVDVGIVKYKNGQALNLADVLAIEEPLEIRLVSGAEKERQEKPVSITMRTPGADKELALGFLFTEGILQNFSDVESVDVPMENVVRVAVSSEVQIDIAKLDRHFYTTSSCGVCGKTSIEAIHNTSLQIIPDDLPSIKAKTIQDLPARLLDRQTVFDQTGGIHAAGLFDLEGQLVLLREDVGRHNALDKLIGSALSDHSFPLHDFILVLSGRISFELIQKALVAGIPYVVAVGAPSSLAIELASSSGITTVGFVRDGQLNVYSNPHRITS